MEEVINSHVSRLGRYLPFDPRHDQIYAERADIGVLPTIETVAVRRLRELVGDPSVRVVVLTGDAGHGKTHLCRDALEDALGVTDKEAHRLLIDHGDGSAPAGRAAGRDFFVIRDLSELRSSAAPRLIEAVEGEGRITIVCANEGKLRAVVADSDGKLEVLRETLEDSQRTGRIAIDPGIVVIDLNHQSVTANGEKSFLSLLLDRWVVDKRRWTQCRKCPAQEWCPILANRDDLADEGDDEFGPVRRDGLLMITRIIEQIGTSVTIREALILVAYAITGSTDCKSVQRGSDQDSTDVTFRYFQVLFEAPLTRDQRASLPLLELLARIDPGRTAIRSVDETLVSGSPDAGSSKDQGKPRTRKQLRTEASKHREMLAAMRRRDFFDLATDREMRRLDVDQERLAPRAARLGLRHHSDFQAIVDANGGAGETGDIRDRLLRGLEAVQDIRRGGDRLLRFAIVDPAYGNVSGAASILATDVKVKDIEVCPQSAYWRSIGMASGQLPDSVDWNDRRIAVVFRPKGSELVSIELNLQQFEFVLRSAAGLTSRSFFEGDIRRISSRLDVLATAAASDNDEIKVVFGDAVYEISVQDDGQIYCEDAT
jgi:hypothetical protein